MMKLIIKQIEIPMNIKQEYSDYKTIELYDDCIVCKGEKRKRIFLFDEYRWLCWLPEGYETEYAQLIFIEGNNITVTDTDRICFSNSKFVEKLFSDISKIFYEYKKMP